MSSQIGIRYLALRWEHIGRKSPEEANAAAFHAPFRTAIYHIILEVTFAPLNISCESYTFSKNERQEWNSYASIFDRQSLSITRPNLPRILPYGYITLILRKSLSLTGETYHLRSLAQIWGYRWKECLRITLLGDSVMIPCCRGWMRRTCYHQSCLYTSALWAMDMGIEVHEQQKVMEVVVVNDLHERLIPIFEPGSEAVTLITCMRTSLPTAPPWGISAREATYIVEAVDDQRLNGAYNPSDQEQADCSVAERFYATRCLEDALYQGLCMTAEARSRKKFLADSHITERHRIDAPLIATTDHKRTQFVEPATH
ncbi:glycoside hydrolase family 3 protein [Moniliophthora roreri]|nr:glycoside hydrolase family 3 protein [Moniliophthora roreri]